MHQSLVTGCQIRNIFDKDVCPQQVYQKWTFKVKGRYLNIDKYLNFTFFRMIQQLKHILQWS